MLPLFLGFRPFDWKILVDSINQRVWSPKTKDTRTFMNVVIWWKNISNVLKHIYIVCRLCRCASAVTIFYIEWYHGMSIIIGENSRVVFTVENLRNKKFVLIQRWCLTDVGISLYMMYWCRNPPTYIPTLYESTIPDSIKVLSLSTLLVL